jgi:hypothetical protein
MILSSLTKIFVNGAWVGVHRDPEMVVKRLLDVRRRMDKIASEVSIFRDIKVYFVFFICPVLCTAFVSALWISFVNRAAESGGCE